MLVSTLVVLSIAFSGQDILRTPVEPSDRGATLANPLPFGRGLEYPGRALEQGVSGSVTIRCMATSDGAISACEVLEETPPGMGFGRAALSAARYQKLPEGSSLMGQQVFLRARFSVNE